MKLNWFLFLFLIPLFSCDRVKSKSQEALNQTGEVVGKSGSEFFSGISEGVQKTFQSTVELDAGLTEKGVTAGKFFVSGAEADATNNKLTVYLIFNETFKDTVRATILDRNGVEYGRVYQLLEGRKGDARYHDFEFDNRTHVESNSKFLIEIKPD
ncbi:MAG TPA: hypothetical protein VK927_01860 [Adhaeribacter sp.]|nr:hypothetical protein [Adhaeribacter sp.]